MIVSPTLQINRRSAMFVRDGQLFIKLSKQHPTSDKRPDIYIIKKLSVAELKKINQWTGDMIDQLNKEQNNAQETRVAS